MVILGIDPGYGRVGYGIIHVKNNMPSYADAGCIETRANTPPDERISIIYSRVKALIKQHGPAVLALERLYFAKNTKTALRVAESRGALLLLGNQYHVSLREFTPLEVKMALCGYGRAEKQQVGYMVKNILRLPGVPKPDDAADALAIAITAAAHHVFST